MPAMGLGASAATIIAIAAGWRDGGLAPRVVGLDAASIWPEMVWALPTDNRKRWPGMRWALPYGGEIWPGMVWPIEPTTDASESEEPGEPVPATPRPEQR